MIRSPPTDRPDPSKSLANMLKAQYLSREFNDVFSSTEFREGEIVGLAGALACRFISLILTYEPKKYRIYDEDDYDIWEWIEGIDENTKARVELCDRFLSDPNAMVFALEDAYLYAFGLCRQSLSRQSRKEAVDISTAHIQREVGVERLGLGRRIIDKLTFRKSEE